LESSGRTNGNETGSNGSKEKENELANRKRELGGKVEELYSGKEQETFKEEWKQSVNVRGLSNVLRKLLKRGMN
jgi:hypothetical protein